MNDNPGARYLALEAFARPIIGDRSMAFAAKFAKGPLPRRDAIRLMRAMIAGADRVEERLTALAAFRERAIRHLAQLEEDPHGR